MKPYEIGLATGSPSVTTADLEKVAKALQEQAHSHVLPVWGVWARVTVVDRDNVPTGVWPIVILDKLPGDVHGFHSFDNGVSYAEVLAADGWMLAASHEFVEMLVDPTGVMTHRGRKMELKDGELVDLDDHVDYLVEACDPVEDASHGYLIDDVPVSDFYTKHYFDETKRGDRRYSHTGKLAGPRQIAPNGYLSWQDPVSKQYFQLIRRPTLEIRALTARPEEASLAPRTHTQRGHVDSQTETARVTHMRANPLPRA